MILGDPRGRSSPAVEGSASLISGPPEENLGCPYRNPDGVPRRSSVAPLGVPSWEGGFTTPPPPYLRWSLGPSELSLSSPLGEGVYRDSPSLGVILEVIQPGFLLGMVRNSNPNGIKYLREPLWTL